MAALAAASANPVRSADRVCDILDTLASAQAGAMLTELLRPERVRSILAATGMPAITEAAIIEPGTFLAELDRVGERGYAVDGEESQPDGRCVAVAIRGLSFPAGISISAPVSRLRADRVPAAARQLRSVADTLSRRMAR